jgi:predicted aldo/keto reductase-like oxidoreductase
MRYRRCGNSGVRLPEISLGPWHNFGDTSWMETQRAVLRRAFDLGVTHFDLANNYGTPFGSAEANFGAHFRADFRPYRDELFIATNAGNEMWAGPYGEWGSRKHLLAGLDQSLRRLGMQFVDVGGRTLSDARGPDRRAARTAAGPGRTGPGARPDARAVGACERDRPFADQERVKSG